MRVNKYWSKAAQTSPTQLMSNGLQVILDLAWEFAVVIFSNLFYKYL